MPRSNPGPRGADARSLKTRVPQESYRDTKACTAVSAADACHQLTGIYAIVAVVSADVFLPGNLGVSAACVRNQPRDSQATYLSSSIHSPKTELVRGETLSGLLKAQNSVFISNQNSDTSVSI